MTTAAYVSSLVPAQSCADHQPPAVSAHLREIEITQPDELATRFLLRVPSALITYETLWDATKFDEYYYDKLYRYIKGREQSLAEKNDKHGRFPVSLAKVGKLVFMLSSLVYLPSDWPTVPLLKEVFTPLTNLKQFAGGVDSRRWK